MKTLTPGQNTDQPSKSTPVSARGLSSALMGLAKAEGRGGDILITADCTVNDIFRAVVKNKCDRLHEVVKRSVEDE